MSVRDRFRAGLARQLSRPEGVRGRLVGTMLNRGNRPVVTAAVDAAAPRPGETVADLGFGGGVGLRLLRERVGPTGHVHGVELSDTMLAAARRRHEKDVAAGRMTLQPGVLERLPLESGTIDALVTLNTLYFVEDVAPVFAELARVLGPAGRAVVGVGDPVGMARMPFTATRFHLRPVVELVAGLQAVGLDVRHERVGKGEDAFHLLVATPERG